VLGIELTHVRGRADRDQAHLAHVPLHVFAIDDELRAAQLGRDPPRAVERRLCVDLVDPMLQPQLARRRRDEPIVQGRTVDPEQLGLYARGQSAVGALDERHPLRASHRGHQNFF
jgi:hypothetical protein